MITWKNFCTVHTFLKVDGIAEEAKEGQLTKKTMERRYHRLDWQDSGGVHNNSKRQQELDRTSVSFRGLPRSAMKLENDDITIQQRLAIMMFSDKVRRSKVEVTAWHNVCKNCKIINNSAGDCFISLKFRTEFDHVTLDVSRTFKVNRSKVKVTAWHNVSAKKRYNSGTDSCRRWNLVKLISEPSATRDAMFKVIRSNTAIAITPTGHQLRRLHLEWSAGVDGWQKTLEETDHTMRLRRGIPAWSLSVMRQRWRSHHSIRSSRKLHAASKIHGSLLQSRNYCFLYCGNREFRAFCCCDIDLDPTTFIYKLHPSPSPWKYPRR